MISLISHFFNEAYLLPSWIRHHREMFDRAILFDYSSTDDSRRIISKLAPSTWEVHQSRNKEFGAVSCDLEVMEAERSVTGWKIALNTTEFLVFPDVHGAVESLKNMLVEAVRIAGYIVVDSDPLGPRKILEDVPLYEQFRFGVPELWQERRDSDRARFRPVGRLLHSFMDGKYSPGRHAWLRDDGQLPLSKAAIFWFGFAPWSPEFVARKQQIGGRLAVNDVASGYGMHHQWGLEELEASRLRFLSQAMDLRTSRQCQSLLDAVHYRQSFSMDGLELTGNPYPFGGPFREADLKRYLCSHLGLDSESPTDPLIRIGQLIATESQFRELQQAQTDSKKRRFFIRR